MDHEKTPFQVLFEKYKGGTATPEEVKQLFALLSNDQYDHEIQELLRSELEETAAPHEDAQSLAKSLHQVKTRIALLQHQPPNRYRTLRHFLPYAAAILIALTVTLWFFRHQWGANVSETAIAEILDIAPGGNKATLILADGRTIDLDQAQTGIVVGEQGITYRHDTSEIVTLNASKAIVDTLTLATPKGGTYQLRLPDGSRVWLNAATTIRYPIRFDGKSRGVEISGEAYFMVAKDASRPFYVRSQEQEVQVLGTSFNISAYTDELHTKTTLVEGSVRVRAISEPTATLTIVPGEQSSLSNGELTKEQVNTQQYTSWKDGYFLFNESLESIMSRLARWYDVDVVYEKGVDKSMQFGGEISTDRPISSALGILEMTEKVRFRIEQSIDRKERRVIVMP